MAAAKDPWLLTPGPLTTSAATKEAMLHDWGSRDAQFIETNARVLRRLLDIAGAAETHVCVPLQGSGTFAIESVIDEIAQQLDMDPIELRLKNAVVEGDPTAMGMPHPRIGFVECLEAIRESDHYRSPVPDGAARGIGRLPGG
jgi:CO/xanthine dehydrogenase Mo-binding subunit